MGLFVLAFGIGFRDRVLPTISSRASCTSSFPSSIFSPLGSGPCTPTLPSTPPSFFRWRGSSRRRCAEALQDDGRGSRCVGFLLAMVYLVPCQWPAQRLQGARHGGGKPGQAHRLLLHRGGAALLFFSYALYLILLIPVTRRRNLIERLLEGPQDPADRLRNEHAAALISRVDGAGMDGTGPWLLLGLHGSVLALDYAYRLVEPAILANISVLLVSRLLSRGTRPRAVGSNPNPEEWPHDRSTGQGAA